MLSEQLNKKTTTNYPFCEDIVKPSVELNDTHNISGTQTNNLDLCPWIYHPSACWEGF